MMKRKRKSSRRRVGLGAARGTCKTVVRRDGKRQQLCKTGKGVTGWTLMSLSGKSRKTRRRRKAR